MHGLPVSSLKTKVEVVPTSICRRPRLPRAYCLFPIPPADLRSRRLVSWFRMCAHFTYAFGSNTCKMSSSQLETYRTSWTLRPTVYCRGDWRSSRSAATTFPWISNASCYAITLPRVWHGPVWRSSKLKSETLHPLLLTVHYSERAMPRWC